jgi:hypothetical protein
MTTNQNPLLVIALCFAFAYSALAQNKADELKQRVLAQAQSMSADDNAFTRTSRGEQISNGKTEVKVTVEKFDPTKSGDARWTLVSVDAAPPTTAELKQYQAESAKRRVPGYYRLANYVGTPATSSMDSHNRTVFHFSPLPKDTARVMDTDVSHNATADVTVNETSGAPFAEQVRVTVKPMRIKLIAKLEAYESTSRYRMGPEGKPILMEQTVDLSGSGMGQEGRGHVVLTYSDYRAVKNGR